ncbi:hypothetical protein, partial [Plesiomonas shigelloides]|uniref:hypothetical protein n=1 Tax=Plesiomonas shigelloides TaxID=703 RepID=UPI00387EFA99
TRILRPFQTAAHASMLRYAPVTKCYLKGEFNRLSWFKLQAVAKLVFVAQLYSFFDLALLPNGRVV